MEGEEVGAGGERRSWLYVAGAGRSGSTLLGMVLGREAGAFNCGELILLWSRLSADALCQCGVPVTRCEVWADVAAGVRRQLGSPSFAELAERIAGLRPWHLDARVPRPTAADVELREVTERAVEEVTGASTLIDTSKASFALATATYRKRPLTVVHLVRDPRAVAYSNLQAKVDPARAGAIHLAPRPVWKSALQWSMANLCTERVLHGLVGRSRLYSATRLRYEAMTLAPDDSLAPVVASMAAPAGRTSVPGGHAVAGNPVLFDEAPIRPDDRWISAMTRGQNVVVAAIAGPLMVRYGYRLDPSRPRPLPGPEGTGPGR